MKVTAGLRAMIVWLVLAARIRTCDLLITNQLLYRLSYASGTKRRAMFAFET